MIARSPTSLRTRLIVMVGLVALTWIAFAELRHHEFIAYDDTAYVTHNPRVQRGLTIENVRWALTSMEAGYWHPLTWWSHMLDCELFGLDAGGHHLTSLVLHAAAAVALFVALDLLTGAPGRSAFVAALFAVHPQHVESVAYVAERKDVLSGLFFMLTLVAYARYAAAPSLARYGLVALAFVLAVAAKPMVVTLPFVLLLLDVWPLRRIGVGTAARGGLGRVVLEKVPLFALAAVASLVTARGAAELGAVADLAGLPLRVRIANALLAYATYLGKTFWPARLACFYPYPQSFDATRVTLAAIGLVAMSLVAALAVRRRPYVTVGWFWYVGMLLPVIGLVQVGQHAMADRYTYLPLVGIFVAITWLASDLVSSTNGRRATAVLAVLAVAACVARTRIEVAHWRDSFTVFEHALAVTERNHVAHNNLGLAYQQAHRPEDARRELEAALAIVPDYTDARNNLALALRDLDRGPEAVAMLREVTRQAPADVAAHFNLGETLLKLGDLPGAVTELQAAADLDPQHANAQMQLGAALRLLGRPEDAVAHAERAVALDPTSAESECYLADALADLGRLDDAVAHYGRAVALRPDFADAHYNFGITLARRGDMERAIAQFRAAVTAAPEHAEAQNNLGKALAAVGKWDDAVVAYGEAIRVRPDFVTALANRAQAYDRLGKAELASADRARAAALDPSLR